jgi:hypothetical protein
MVRELWSDIHKFGRLKTTAEIRALQLKRDLKDFGDYQFTVRPVTNEEVSREVQNETIKEGLLRC